MLEKSRNIDTKIKNQVSELRQNSFQKSISNNPEPNKPIIHDRLKKVASVQSELNKNDNTEFGKY